ncbi:acyltransferase [Vibrio sp. 10N.286.48.B8]|uniref:acyltransferase family protein n=1 Tax=Vibrio sp. 10N.286.48.B8 TaxID=2056189 RepID=UPI000D392A2F|nr:acyltransferase [Vibrio sp. 10N.286.48.B8]PTO96265.1 acyltransferase [Vibrio sp. 10N.286.48.B8]
MKRFEVLDSFRGLCAIAVVCFHIRVLEGFTELPFFRGSAILVDFFFVLSGFVLTHGYASKAQITFKKFLLSRFFRLYPLHFFTLVTIILFEVIKYTFFHKFGWSFNYEPFTGKTSLSQFIPNLLLIQSWYPGFESLSFNYPSWSISVEFYLYIIFYCTLFFTGINRTILWVLISLLAFVSIFYAIDFLTINSLRGLTSFFGGALVYLIYEKSPQPNLSYRYATIFEFMCIVLSILLVGSEFSLRQPIAIFMFIVVVFVFAQEKGAVSNILRKKFFINFGKLSYSIYMIHVCLLFILSYIMLLIKKIMGVDFTQTIDGVRFVNFGGWISNSIYAIMTLFFVIIMSNFTYKYIELKFSSMGKRFY